MAAFLCEGGASQGLRGSHSGGAGPFCQTGRRGDARLELPEAKDSGDPEEVTQKAERVALLLPESRLS